MPNNQGQMYCINETWHNKNTNLLWPLQIRHKVKYTLLWFNTQKKNNLHVVPFFLNFYTRMTVPCSRCSIIWNRTSLPLIQNINQNITVEITICHKYWFPLTCTCRKIYCNIIIPKVSLNQVSFPAHQFSVSQQGPLPLKKLKMPG